jgi:hypothetical protein
MCFTLCVSVSCINLDNLQMPETCNCSPRKNKILILSLFVQRLLPCAEYSLSDQYSAFYIFVFGRHRKIRFRSITNLDTCLTTKMNVRERERERDRERERGGGK